jgi:hypothetical protein
MFQRRRSPSAAVRSFKVVPFLTTDLQFVGNRLLSDTEHSGFSSMVTLGGIVACGSFFPLSF